METSTADRPTADTRERLLDVAERLFAEAGIEKVSMREIVRESGQRNLSAATYHFGSRDALIAALIERRIRVINALRHERLDALAALGLPSGDAGARDLVSVSTAALADAVRRFDWGPAFVRVSAQALFSPQVELARRVPRDAISSLSRTKRMLRSCLPALPAPVFDARMRLVNSHATYVIAGWVQAQGPVSARNAAAFGLMVRDTVDFLAGGLVAPVGPSASRFPTVSESLR
jgi:AcrR family transcriptional regulator